VPIREKLARRAKKAGLTLQGELIEALATYFDLLRKWNLKVSLTSLPVEDAGDEAIDRLLIEPLLVVRYLPGPDASVVDIGSGGGSPAIPMKLAASGISLRMVESKTRKAAFLREIVRRLELEKTVVESLRFEELLVRPALHEAVDIVSLRAVRAEPKVLMGLQAFLKPGGALFLFRSVSPVVDAELVALPLAWEASHSLIPALNSRLIIFRKHPVR
jgi:16S rRNA (guanine527-N7)-methyltransferase